MENPKPAAGAGGGRKEPSLDPVKAERILADVSRKIKITSKNWPQKWGFYLKKPEIMKEQAQKLGLSEAEYQAAVESMSCRAEPAKYPEGVIPGPSPLPLPLTTSGMIGHRVNCPLEKYGPLWMTPRNYPLYPRPPPGQVYDPYKQTMIFLGSVDGDPISHKLTPMINEKPYELYTEPRTLEAAQFCKETLLYALTR